MNRQGLRSPMIAALAILSLSVGMSGQAPTTKGWTPPRTPDGQPDLQGYWTNQGSISTVNIEGTASPLDSPIIDPADKKLPFIPWALAKRDEIKANHLDPRGRVEYVDSQTRCLPAGVPRINYATPYNGYHFLQRRGSVIMLAEWNHTYRVIPLAGRPHVGQNIRLWMGDSRGRWEGNTLVVDVTNFTDKTWFDEVGNFHSDALHVVERFTIVDANTINYEALIEDPKVFTRPWRVAFAFKRATAGDGTTLLNAGRLEPANAAQSDIIFFKDSQTPDYELFEYACHEGNRAIEMILGRDVMEGIMRSRPAGSIAR